MSDAFDSPSSGARITDFEGKLLLVKPTSKEEGISTTFGPADAIVADVVVLDGGNDWEQYSDVYVFQKALQGQLKAKVGSGRYVLGRLGKGTAKPGQSPPWLLEDPTEEDKEAARTYLKSEEKPPPF
jgi:hypothetical protein